MCSNTVLGSLMHLKGSNLNFKRLSIRSDQRGMQRLVHIWFGHCNIVLETSWNWLIHLMDHTKCRITVLHCIYQDTHCKQIVNLINRLILIYHLFIDTEKVFYTAVNLCLNSGFYHMLMHSLDNIPYEFLTDAFTKCYFLNQIIINIWFQIFQGKVIQLYFDLGNTKTLCDRRIDVHRLSCLLLLFLRSHVLKSTHIMKTVCKLDQNNTDILCHGKEHLAKALCLQLYFILGIGQLTDLSYPIYQKRNLRTKFSGDLITGHPGIFNSIVKKACYNGLLVQFQIRQNNGNT